MTYCTVLLQAMAGHFSDDSSCTQILHQQWKVPFSSTVTKTKNWDARGSQLMVPFQGGVMEKFQLSNMTAAHRLTIKDMDEDAGLGGVCRDAVISAGLVLKSKTCQFIVLFPSLGNIAKLSYAYLSLSEHVLKLKNKRLNLKEKLTWEIYSKYPNHNKKCHAVNERKTKTQNNAQEMDENRKK